MAYLHTHNNIFDVINKSRIRTAALEIKSTVYPDDPSIENFIQNVVEMADDYERQFVPRARGWSNQ